jgi:hypothetical protein
MEVEEKARFSGLDSDEAKQRGVAAAIMGVRAGRESALNR